MNTTNKTAEERVEELSKKIAMFPDQDILPEDMMIDYDRVKVGDIYNLLTQAHQQGERDVQERIKPFVERVRLDVEVMVCDCGEKYKDSDLDISVGDLEQALTEVSNNNE